MFLAFVNAYKNVMNELLDGGMWVVLGFLFIIKKLGFLLSVSPPPDPHK